MVESAVHQSFYQNWDRSYALSLLADPRGLQLLGQGRHFTAYRFKRGDFSYTLCIARPAFQTEQSIESSRWTRAITKIQRVDHPMIPPMEIIENMAGLAYIRPYCESLVMTSAIQTSAKVVELKARLQRAGLLLDDYFHIGYCGSEAFVLDWSDLKFQRSML